MAWCRTALWIWLFAAVYERCCSSPSSFSNSLSLARSVRARVQQLLLRYKEEQFGDRGFDDKRIVLNTLPTVTMSYRTWLHMEDTERLYRASRDLQSFWTHLDSQRQKLQLNGDRTGQREMKKRNRRGKPFQSLSQGILGIQLDLRDLMRQVKSQLLSMRTLRKNPDPTGTPPSSTPRPSETSSSAPGTSSTLDSILPSTLRTTSVPTGVQPGVGVASSGPVLQDKPKSAPSQWVSALEGYVILRDLERYLSKLVRDYTLLRAKS